MKLIILIAMLSGFCVGCSVDQPAGAYDAQAARSNIIAALPSGWSVITPSEAQDRFTAAYFTHPQTEAFLLVGPQSNHINWTDTEGSSHRENLAKECLYIWLVPGDFKPPFPRFPSEPSGVDKLFLSANLRAYGHDSHHITDTNRMDAIIKKATKVSSPRIKISWLSWQQDIAESLKR